MAQHQRQIKPRHSRWEILVLERPDLQFRTRECETHNEDSAYPHVKRKFSETSCTDGTKSVDFLVPVLH